MAKKLSVSQRGRLLDLVGRIIEHTTDGTLAFNEVCAGLETLIDGKKLVRAEKAPTIRASPDAQIEMVSRFLDEYGDGQYGFRPSDIPAVPDSIPRDDTTKELLVLTVFLPHKGREAGLKRTVDAWWKYIDPPIDVTKLRREDIRSDPQHLRLVPGMKYIPGVRWVLLNPSSHHGKSPKYAIAQSQIDGTTLAQAEVLMAAAQHPEWVLSWDGEASPFPNMSGLQVHSGTGWLDTLFLNRNRHLNLGAWSATSGIWGSKWASPTVKVLKSGS